MSKQMNTKDTRNNLNFFTRAVLAACMMIVVLLFTSCSHGTESSYTVDQTNIVIQERAIPENYQQYQDNYLELYYPSSWTQQDMNDAEAYFKSPAGDNLKISLADKNNFDFLQNHKLVLAGSVKSVKQIDYMGHEMILLTFSREVANYKMDMYSTHFVSGDKTVIVTVTLSNANDSSVFDSIYQSILIK